MIHPIRPTDYAGLSPTLAPAPFYPRVLDQEEVMVVTVGVADRQAQVARLTDPQAQTVAVADPQALSIRFQ